MYFPYLRSDSNPVPRLPFLLTIEVFWASKYLQFLVSYFQSSDTIYVWKWANRTITLPSPHLPLIFQECKMEHILVHTPTNPISNEFLLIIDDLRATNYICIHNWCLTLIAKHLSGKQ